LAGFALSAIGDERISRTATTGGEFRGATRRTTPLGTTIKTTDTGGRLGGTIRWMAPELLYPDGFGFTGKIEKQLPSKDTDIYAIGMTILEVSARLPPIGDTGFTP